MAETPKKKIGKYEVIEELGRGAMGVVYRARDPFIGRLVALKTITPGLLDNPDLLQRFYREAQAAGRLQHPNIVIIYDLGEADGLPYIAMEFLEGNSLEKLIQHTPNMPLGQKLDIIIQLCRGLDFAHKNGVVHRDIKPGNIIVMTDGTVKVVDFGIVRLSSTSMTSTGMVIGTVGYMSPEQAQGEHVDARSDLFSVGVVMYELFAYKKPFAGNNVAAVLIKIVTEDPSPLEGAAPQVPPQLCEIVHRCLNKNPAERYQSLEDLILELEPIARSMQRDMVEELVKQGQQLVEKEEFTEARSLLRNALKLDSSHSAAKTLMGKVDTEIRRLEIHPKVQKFLETGQGLLEEGKYEEAGKQFQEVLKLDTQHGQAKELLEKAREEVARAASIRQGLSTGAQALNQGDLTVAESELGKVLELDQESPEAKALIDKLGSERSAREKRARFQEAMRQARSLLIRESYEECVQLLGGLEKEFAQEEELQQLLHTAREGLEEQKRRQAINAKANEARALLLDQKHEEAVQFLETAAKEFPEEDEFKRLLETAREGWEQQKRRETIAAKSKEARALLGQQKYQESVQLLEAAVEEFPEEEEFKRLLETAREGWEQQKRGESVAARTKEARDLLGQQKYQESVQLLEAAVKEFPDETGFTRLLRTAREGWEQQKKRETLAAKTDEARTLLGQQEYQQALSILDELLKSYPRETAVVKLRKLVVQEEKEYERQQQYDKDRAKLQELIQKKDYAAALELGDRLQKEFTDDTEVGRLVASVRREKKAAERQEQLATARQSIEKLLEEKKFDQAIRDAEKALKKFKGESALSDLLAQAKRSKQGEEKKAELEKRVRSIKGAIERGDLTDAIDLGRQTLTIHPKDTDVTQLLSFAKRELQTREKKKKRDDQLKTAVASLEHKDFDQATMILKDVAKEFPFDSGIKQLLNAAQAGEVPVDAATMIGMIPSGKPAADAAPSAETQYIMQGAPASAATPPSPAASTQPQPVPAAPPPEVKPPPTAPPAEAKPAAPPVVEPEVKKPPKPKPKAKPAAPPVVEPEVKKPPKPKPPVRPKPAVEVPPAVKPAVKAPPAPSLAVPEVEVPLWKKPAGMAIGGVVIMVLAAGLYFGFSGGTDTATEPTDATAQQTGQPDQPQQPPPPSPAEQQQSLIDEAQKLADGGNYNGALGKLSDAERIQGPLGNRIGQLRTQINEEVQNAGVRQIRQQEAQLWTQAEGHLNANRFDQAQRGFQQVLDLPQGGRRRADAQRFIREVIPQRRQEESLFSQARTAAQQRGNESRLQEADRLLGQVIGMNGPRLQEAQQLQTTVRQQLDGLAQQKAAADRQQQIASVEGQIQQDLGRENFQAARQKVPQIQGLGGNPANSRGKIDRAERQKFNQLESQFNRVKSNKGQLEQLVPEFRKLEQSGGPLVAQARDYINNRIPGAIRDLEAAAKPPPTPSLRQVSCTVQPATPARWDRPVSAGQNIGQKFIDGGVKLNSAANCGLPANLTQNASEGSQVMIFVQIDENGRVNGGRHLSGDAGVGNAVVEAAQRSWQFTPPKVNGTAVKTSAAVTVKF